MHCLLRYPLCFCCTFPTFTLQIRSIIWSDWCIYIYILIYSAIHFLCLVCKSAILIYQYLCYSWHLQMDYVRPLGVTHSHPYHVCLPLVPWCLVLVGLSPLAPMPYTCSCHLLEFSNLALWLYRLVSMGFNNSRLLSPFASISITVSHIFLFNLDASHMDPPLRKRAKSRKTRWLIKACASIHLYVPM